jgi:ADP-heptose:LPS heptosyltransferase
MTRERILLVQTAFLGDVIRRHRSWRRCVVTAPRRTSPCWTPAAAPLVQDHPALDAVLIDDSGATVAACAGSSGSCRRSGRAASRSRSPRRNRCARRSHPRRGIPRRIGFATAPAAALYTERAATAALHDRDRLLGLLAPLGITHAFDPALLRPRIVLDDATRHGPGSARPARRGGRPFAALCPGSAWRTTLARAVVRGWRAPWMPTAIAACCSGPDERALTAAVHAASDGRAIDLGGATDLPLLAAVLGEAAVAVTNDSAPCTSRPRSTPQVAIFAPPSPRRAMVPGRRAVVVERDSPVVRAGGTAARAARAAPTTAWSS